MSIFGKTLIFSFFCLFLLTGVFLISRGSEEKETSIYNNSAQEKRNPSLEQKIGQLFIIGIEGTKPSREIEKLIKEIRPGGILLLKRNIVNKDQVKELVSFLQKTSMESSGLPLFVAVDQEGGLVSRVEWAEKTPQFRIEGPDKALEIGRLRGEDLREMGINLNLAPLVDGNRQKDFLFNRSFQQENRALLAAALVQGQQLSGILSCLKHFPGYDNIDFNPEEELAYVEKIPEISRFEKASRLSEMVMVSNVVYKEIDEDLPFSFSKKGVSFLKEYFSEDIIIVSDDLSQSSLLNKFSLEEIVGLPVKAGVDLLIFSGWRKPAPEGVEALLSLARAGEIDEARINDSFNKIVELKSLLINE